MADFSESSGGFENVMYVLVYMFAAALLIFIVYFIFGQVKDPVDTGLSSAIPGGDQAFNVTNFNAKTEGGLGMLDNMYPFLVLGLIIMVIVSAFFIGDHPVFFFVTLIILGVVILLGVVFSNIYQQISTEESFGTTEEDMSIIHIFMQYLPFIIAVIVGMVMVVLYAKPTGSGSI